MINFDTGIQYGVVDTTDYSFLTIEQISFDFENLIILCLGAEDLTRLIRPHSLACYTYNMLHLHSLLTCLPRSKGGNVDPFHTTYVSNVITSPCLRMFSSVYHICKNNLLTYARKK
jgi:hypothetical protein